MSQEVLSKKIEFYSQQALERLNLGGGDGSWSLNLEETSQTLDEQFSAILQQINAELPGVDGPPSEAHPNPLLFSDSLEDGGTEVINGVLDAIGEKLSVVLTETLIAMCEKMNVNAIDVQTWLGPQAAGKGTQTEAISSTAGDESWDQETLSADLKTLVTHLRSIKVIATGTDGIFLPRDNQDYEIFQSLGNTAGQVVRTGALLSPQFTHAMVLMEMIRGVGRGESTFQIDTYPRAVSQMTLLTSLGEALKAKGKNFSTNIILLDLVDPEGARTIDENKINAKMLAEGVAGSFTSWQKEPAFSEIESAAERLTNATTPLTEGLTEGQAAGDMIEELIVALKAKFDAMGVAQDQPGADELGATKDVIAGSLLLALERMKGRVSKADKVRPDEMSIAGILKRLQEYLGDTYIVALQNSSNTIPGNAAPAIVTGSILANMCEALGVNADDLDVVDFITAAQKRSEEIVAKR